MNVLFELVADFMLGSAKHEEVSARESQVANCRVRDRRHYLHLGEDKERVENPELPQPCSGEEGFGEEIAAYIPWNSESMNDCGNEWMNWWMDWWMRQWLIDWLNEWMNDWMNERINECMNKWWWDGWMNQGMDLLKGRLETCQCVTD